LHCPHCGAEFPFSAWQRAATCPNCDRRLTFFEAVGSAPPTVAGGESPAVSESDAAAMAAARAAAITAASAQDLSAIVAMTARAATIGSEAPRGDTIVSGRPLDAAKPLRWSGGFTALLVIWSVAAVCLLGLRLEVQRNALLTPGEQAAIVAVQRSQLERGVTYEKALEVFARSSSSLSLLRLSAKPSGSAHWVATDRPWQRSICVFWQHPGDAILSWTVQNGAVRATGATARLLRAAVTLAQQPSSSPLGLPQL
jgi:hypothetical protein